MPTFTVTRSMKQCLARLASAIEPEESFKLRKTTWQGGRPLTGWIDGSKFQVQANATGARPTVKGVIIDEGAERRVALSMPGLWLLLVFFLATNGYVIWVGIQLQEWWLPVFWGVASIVVLSFHLISAATLIAAIRDVLNAEA